MAISGSSNKAKIAKRVVEVLDFFDDDHREATVMDIVRRYNRPQSSTSELLSSLVELGLLYKDPYSRSYSLSPRAAMLGSNGQDGPMRDGRLVRLLDRLAAQTGLAVSLNGMVGLNAQVISSRSSARGNETKSRAIHNGMQETLLASAVGWLMLSTIPQPRCDGVVRRLIAEANDDTKITFPEMITRLQLCRDSGNGAGPAGFGSDQQVIAVLLPNQRADHPLVLGLLYGADQQINTENLIACIKEAIAHCLLGEEANPASVELISSAA